MLTKLMMVMILLGMVASGAWAKEWTVRKNLGDLNGDGVKEVAVEKWSDSGSSGKCAGVQIFSGKKKVLSGLIGVDSDCADGYRVIGSQIISWSGNWDDDDKWHPHAYDFAWFSWDKKQKLFQAVKRGRTRKKYTYSQAKKILPPLAINPKDQIVICYSEPTMSGAAIEAIYQRAKKVKETERDRFILKEIGALHCRQNEERDRKSRVTMTQKERKSWGQVGISHFSVYRITIYKNWAQVSFDGGPVEPGAEIFRKNHAGRWELVASGNEFSGWIEDGTIPKDIAKHIKIY